MTKKNMIMVAVFINVALLTVLFFTAISSDDAIDTAAYAPEKKEPVAYVENPAFERKQKAIDAARASLVGVDVPKKEESPKSVRAITHKLPPAASEEAKLKQNPSEYQEIVVKKGDSLELIAKKYSVSVESVIALNRLASTSIRENQCLKIPRNKEKEQPKVQEKKEKASSKAVYYVVKVGDNPWTIAMKHHMKVSDLLKLNQLDDRKARRLKPGDRLRIR